MSIKCLKPFFPIPAPPRVDRPDRRSPLSLLRARIVTDVESLLKHGGIAGVLPFELQVFYVYSEVYGAEIADAHRMIQGSLNFAGTLLLKKFHSVLDISCIRAGYRPIKDLRGGSIFE